MRWRFFFSRTVAGLLAIGGICWGALLLPLILRAEHLLLPLLVFGPGYIVTLAYLVRATTTPPLRGRQFIWVLSILVQGGWLACYVVATLGTDGAIGRITEPNVIVAWWVFATLASVVALMLEPR